MAFARPTASSSNAEALEAFDVYPVASMLVVTA
jgi:hypothetical protein